MKRREFLGAAGIVATWCALPVTAWAKELTEAVLYAEAVRVANEVELLKRHFRITARATVAPIRADLHPHHLRHIAYQILFKLSLFRHKHGLAGFAPLTHEPDLKANLRTGWSQTQRILTEIRIVKAYLGIPGEAAPGTHAEGKRTIDVFNELNRVSFELDNLTGEPIKPSAVYAEVLRINADTDSLLRQSGTKDDALPPMRKADAQPRDSLQAAFAVMAEIQRLQSRLAIESTDFGAFRKDDSVAPSDVFNMVGMCIAELQPVKVKMGLSRRITPPAEIHQGKVPADVTQLLGYVAAKLRLIHL